jgi:mannonate dehydratase
MNRRQFLSSSSIATAAAATGTAFSEQSKSAPTATAKPALFKIGTFIDKVDDASVKAVARWGIKNIYARAPIGDPSRLYATVEELKRMREIAERNGVAIDMLRPVNLAMTDINVEKHPAIMLGESPQRDRDIEQMQTQVKNCAAAGIPAMRYTLSLGALYRTGTTPGRGDATYRQFKQSDINRNAPLSKAGRVTQDMYWERITYYLDRMVPVANEYKVRLLTHVEDNMAASYRGIDLVHNTIEGVKKYVSIKESPYHGLLFCVGTFSEMLQDPSKEIYDVIRYFGTRKKIFMIDFRNIRGNRQEFLETFPDDGSIDMIRVLQVLKEVGYDGMICPDHTPECPGGPEQVNAFQYGYIRGLIQAVDHMA